MWNAQSHQIWQKSRPVAFNLASDSTGHEHPHFRTAIDNYAGLISAMGLSQDALAARVRSAIEGEPEQSA
jgi:hypothetical protein